LLAIIKKLELSMKQVSKDIKHLESIYTNRVEIMERLLSKGYSEDELIIEFDRYPFKTIWSQNIWGVLMIGLAIFMVHNITYTSGNWEYNFGGIGDFARLNNYVLTRFLILSLLITGVNSLINNGYINKNAKSFLIGMSVLFSFVALARSSILPMISGVICTLFFSMLKVSMEKNTSNAKVIIDLINSGVRNRIEIMKSPRLNWEIKWNNSSTFLLFLMAFCLLLNTPLEYNLVEIKKIGNRTNYRNDIQIIDKILEYGKELLIGLSLLLSILSNIDTQKFRVFFLGGVMFSSLYIIVALFHTNFQNVIYPALIMIAGGVYIIWKRKNC
jgi:hypothetical protein